MHTLNTSLTSCREWSFPTILGKEVPASWSQPMRAEYLTAKVPLRKSHVPLSALHFSHNRLFFPACQCQEPIKEQWWGYNLEKQCKDGPLHCSSLLLLEKRPVVFLYFWLSCSQCFKCYLKTCLNK